MIINKLSGFSGEYVSNGTASVWLYHTSADGYPTNSDYYEPKEFDIMAKITIVGEAVVITSALKLEDIKTLSKYRPQALVLKGGEDGKEPIFRIAATDKSKGSINKYGAEFGGETHDDKKLATITLVCGNTDGGDIREKVAEDIGTAILDLNKLEAALPAVLEEIKAEKTAVLENITIAQ